LKQPIILEEKKVPRFLFSFREIYKILLGMVAYYIPFPSILTAFIHRLRGVKFTKLSGVFIPYHVIIDSVAPEYVEIDEGVAFTRNVAIITHFNPPPAIKEFMGGRQAQKVFIGKGSLILYGAIILPGVRIRKHCVVGAGSVVTKDVPDYTFVAGNPAIPIKSFQKPSKYENSA